LNQVIASTGAQKIGKEKEKGIGGSGSRIRRRRLEFAAVLGGFRRRIPLRLVDDFVKEQREMEEE
jgi:hypothetical protein